MDCWAECTTCACIYNISAVVAPWHWLDEISAIKRKLFGLARLCFCLPFSQMAILQKIIMIIKEKRQNGKMASLIFKPFSLVQSALTGWHEAFLLLIILIIWPVKMGQISWNTKWKGSVSQSANAMANLIHVLHIKENFFEIKRQLETPPPAISLCRRNVQHILKTKKMLYCTKGSFKRIKS